MPDDQNRQTTESAALPTEIPVAESKPALPVETPIAVDPVQQAAPPADVNPRIMDSQAGLSGVGVKPLEPPAPELAPTIEKVPETTPPVQPEVPNPRSFLKKALAVIQFRKRTKFEKIIKLANKKGSVSNDDIEKLLRVSDKTATRYLAELVKTGRLTRRGVGPATRYDPIIGSIAGN